MRISKQLAVELVWTRSVEKSLLRESYPLLVEKLKETDYLAAKQIPSCLAIQGMGSSYVRANPRPLMEVGYPMTMRDRTGKKTYLFRYDEDFQDLADTSWIALKSTGDKEMFFPNSVDLPKQREIDPLKKVITSVAGEGSLGLMYRKEPFEILQTRSFAEDAGLKPAPIVFFPGDVNRLTDKIPATHFKGYNGKSHGKISWAEINDPNVQLDFIFNRTFWGLKLKSLRKSEISVSTWASNLSRRINALLAGKPNPNWSQDYLEKVYLDPLEPRPSKSRSSNLLELLKTVNGEFVGRFLAFPNEQWSWEKFDLFVLDRISYLIDDLFYDGDLGDCALEYTTKYSELKKDRKNFKMHSHRENWEYFSKAGGYRKDTPNWLRPKGELYSLVGAIHDIGLKVQVIGLLSQTRGAGKPPYLDVYKAQIKFLKTVSTQPQPMSAEHSMVLRSLVAKVIRDIPDHYFTGLTTKARVTVEAKACYEKTRAEGGTEAAVADLVWDGAHGVKAMIIDLNNGEKVGEIDYENSTEGEYIFWRCLEVVLTMDPETATTSYLTMIKEPGKARTVTKGSFALKIVLDVVSKICSWPLTKVPSSQSGMGMDAHGWNFFMSLYDNHKGTEPFLIHKVLEERTVGNTTTRVVEYQDLFVECTDYSEATDNMEHKIAEAIGVPWMKRCGIPTLLQKIVVRATMRPKTIEFTARGLFSRIGEETDRDDVRSVRLYRGVLMGDPLTKVILHILNIVVRESGNLLLDKTFWKEMNCLVDDNPPKQTAKYAPKSPGVSPKSGKELKKYFAETPDAIELKRRIEIPVYRALFGKDSTDLESPGKYVQRPTETLGPDDYRNRESAPIGAMSTHSPDLALSAMKPKRANSRS